MADDTDFSALYHALGISSACTPEQFRQAYRRRVARLHPDQRGSAGDVVRLQELNHMYGAAMEFLRTHGRLPGALPPPATQDAAIPEAGPVPAPAPAHAPARDESWRDHSEPDESAPDEAKAGLPRHSRYFIVLALSAIVVLALHALDSPRRQARTAEDDSTGAVSTHQRLDENGKIALGMGKAQVKAIQGAPIGGHDIRWDYGPSWVDFGCGEVVTDWYSSPLRPLQVDSPHPTARDWDRFDAAPPPGC